MNHALLEKQEKDKMQTHEVKYSRMSMTSPSLWFSPYDDDHGAAPPIPVKKLTKHFFSRSFLRGENKKDKNNLNATARNPQTKIPVGTR